MDDIHDQVHAFSDGELPAAQADAFRLHLATCARCQRELSDILQLDGAVAQLPIAAAASVRVARPVWMRREVRAGLALAAAAAVAIAVVPRLFSSPDQVLAPTGPRHLEARVSWALADAWRPYEALRGNSQGDAVPVASLAALEKSGQQQALAGAWLIMGDPARASKLLAALAVSPDVSADLAATALAEHRPEEALELAQRALDASPRHPRALWNKALAATELGLDRLAAATFAEVAGLGEAGWADEAGQRQRALQARADQGRVRYQQFLDAAARMVLDGTPLPPDLAAAAPSTARMYLSYALLAAPTRGRVEALLPLAHTLDGIFGSELLTQTVQRDAAEDFEVRAPLALQFRGVAVDLFRAQASTGFVPKIADDEHGLGAEGGAKFVGQLVKQKQVRFLPLAIPLTRQLGEHFSDFELAVEQQPDPWFKLALTIERARRALAANDAASAEQQWLEAVRQAAQAPLREIQAREQLLLLFLRTHRAAEAQAQAAQVLRLARAQGDRVVEVRVLRLWGDAARLRNARGLARAALTERSLWLPDSCEAKSYLEESMASLDILALEPTAARAALERAGSCGDPLSVVGAFAWSDVLRMDPKPADAARLAAALEVLRAGSLSPAEVALVDQIEGRAKIDADPVKGEALIRTALAGLAGLPPGDALVAKVRAAAFGVLRSTAGGARAWNRMFALTEEERGHPIPSGCALVVEVQDDRVAIAARGQTGAFSGDFRRVAVGAHRHRDGLTIDEIAQVVQPVVLEASKGCAEVSVSAGFPLHGRAGWLPDALAWSWAAGAGKRTPVGKRWLVVSEVDAPAELGLPRLSAWSAAPADAVDGQTLQGGAATPERVLAAMRDASFIELDAHGLVNTGSEDTAMIVLAQGKSGYGLTASAVRAAKLDQHPVVLLGACRAATVAPYLHQMWSLPAAFLDAGASAVIAAPVELPDAEAREFFSRLVTRLKSGEPPARALRDERVAWLSAGRAPWVRTVLVFD